MDERRHRVELAAKPQLHGAQVPHARIRACQELLERERPVVALVANLVDRPHPAPAEPGLDRVAIVDPPARGPLGVDATRYGHRTSVLQPRHLRVAAVEPSWARAHGAPGPCGSSGRLRLPAAEEAQLAASDLLQAVRAELERREVAVEVGGPDADDVAHGQGSAMPGTKLWAPSVAATASKPRPMEMPSQVFDGSPFEPSSMMSAAVRGSNGTSG